MINIHNHQQTNANLMRAVIENPTRYINNKINGMNVLCKIITANKPEEIICKICIPDLLIHEAIRWYHLVLGHPGITRLTDSITLRFCHPHLMQYCKEYRCEDNCTAAKNQNRGYTHLGAREAKAVPWEEVAAVDLIGPWHIVVNNMPLEFKALTAIDPVTNLLEIQQINNKTSLNIAQQFSN